MAGFLETTMTGSVDPILTSFYTKAITGITSYVTAPFTALATISIILAGLAFLNGQLEVSAKKFFSVCLTVGGVAVFALSVSNYNTYIGNYLLTFPDHMMAITAGYGGFSVSTPTTGAQAIDLMIIDIEQAVKDIFNEGEMYDWSPYIYGAVLWIISIILMVVMTVALLMVKVGITIVASLGPLFILGLLFTGSREYFTKWLTFASQFIVAGAILGLYIGLTSGLVKTQISSLASASDLEQIMTALTPLIYLLPVLGVLFVSTTSYASSLSGGISIAVGNALQKITKSGMSGAKLAGNRAARPMKERKEANRSVRMSGARASARKRSNNKAERRETIKLGIKKTIGMR